MSYEPRRIAFLGREGRVKHYGTGMACVWELDVIDFERRAWLRDVLEDDDVEAYLDRVLEPTLV